MGPESNSPRPHTVITTDLDPRSKQTLDRTGFDDALEVLDWGDPSLGDYLTDATWTMHLCILVKFAEALLS